MGIYQRWTNLTISRHGAAATTIAGLSLTFAKYKIALNLLKGDLQISK